MKSIPHIGVAQIFCDHQNILGGDGVNEKGCQENTFGKG